MLVNQRRSHQGSFVEQFTQEYHQLPYEVENRSGDAPASTEEGIFDYVTDEEDLSVVYREPLVERLLPLGHVAVGFLLAIPVLFLIVAMAVQ